MATNYSKRSFLKTALAGVGATMLPNPLSANTSSPAVSESGEPPHNYTILFQGDSITDANRNREGKPNHDIGQGYVRSIVSRLGADFPEAGFTFYNRGISGDKVYQLENRWQEDALSLKPNLLSILAGINDVGDMINDPDYPSIQPGFETSYRNILQASREQNPSLLIVLGLPFIYPMGKRAEKKELWIEYTEEKQQQIRRLAQEFDAILIDYPFLFAQAMKRTPEEYWIGDGVHPSIFGHELMAREWIKQVSTRLDFLKKYSFAD